MSSSTIFHVSFGQVPIRSVRIFTAILELFFQLCVVGTGNYAWINFVGFVPFIALLDDEFLAMFHGREAIDRIVEGMRASASRARQGLIDDRQTYDDKF